MPGMARPGGLAPPVPGNRARSNSDQSSREAPAVAAMDAAPQLGGLFAAGMPKLRKTGGGVDTGGMLDADPSHGGRPQYQRKLIITMTANREASYLSDPESSRSSAPRPPVASAPRPPVGAAPAVPGRAVPGLPTHPSLAGLKRTELHRPHSSASLKGPPPPVGKKPPPPPGSRKPSSNLHSSAAPPSAPAPPPPSSAAPSLPPAPPPPPPSAAPRPPAAPSRAHPPPPPPQVSASSAISSTIAAQAAIRAATAGTTSPVAAPPPPPPPSAPSPRSPAPPPPPPPPSNAPPARAHSGSVGRSMLDPSAFTLMPNGGAKSPSPTRSDSLAGRMNGGGGASRGQRIVVEDPRWKWPDEHDFPKPRSFAPRERKYRAGRGSSVPLDLSVL